MYIYKTRSRFSYTTYLRWWVKCEGKIIASHLFTFNQPTDIMIIIIMRYFTMYPCFPDNETFFNKNIIARRQAYVTCRCCTENTWKSCAETCFTLFLVTRIFSTKRNNNIEKRRWWLLMERKIVKIMMHFVLVIPVTIPFLFDGGNWFRFLKQIILAISNRT